MPATLVSAPAGFGKTLLVTDWLRRVGSAHRVAWVSLDRTDNDPVARREDAARRLLGPVVIGTFPRRRSAHPRGGPPRPRGDRVPDGDRTVARDNLQQALDEAAGAELVRPFVHAGPDVRELLSEQLGSFGGRDDFAGWVLELMTPAGRNRGAAPLTERERSVLARLPTQRSLDEIASDLTVSPNTVKTHVRAIYAKLGVIGRRQAVVVARSRGPI